MDLKTIAIDIKQFTTQTRARVICRFLPMLFVSSYSWSQVIINEFMASNDSIISDEEGNFGDWIELHNTSDDTVDLSGFFLSDDIEKPAVWQIPEGTSMTPGAFLLFWADNKDTGLHTSFSLARQKEEVVLSDRDTVIIDSIRYYDQIRDFSYGRSADNNQVWGYYSTATPEEENTGSFISHRCGRPVFSEPPGFYPSEVLLELVNPDPGSQYYYTLDGSVPTEDSELIAGTLSISQTTVVRVRTFKEGSLPSEVVTATYFINERSRDIDIVSLSTDPYNLWDDDYGIHVVGTNGIERFGIVANYFQKWERPVSVELFTSKGKRDFQVDAGIQISGQYSRINEQKSLAFYLRSEYGYSKLNYPLFPDKPHVKEYNNFLLRNSGSDWPETMFGDAVSQYIVKDQMNTDYMAYRPAAVFLNGEYWGILNIREKINEHYPSSNYGIPADEVDMLESSGDMDSRIVGGSNADYLALRSFFETNDMAVQANYEQAASEIDIEQYTDYQITEIYENNTDWPGNNIKYWRHRTDPDSKWRWVMYDIDRGFGIRGQPPDQKKGGEDNLVRAMTSGKYNFPLTGMMNNAGYKEYFIKRFNAHIAITFHPERVHSIFDEWEQRIETEMEDHLAKWGDYREDWGSFDEKTMEGWRDIVDNKKSWAEERPAIMMDILKDYFTLGDTFRIKLSVSSLQHGYITVNGVKLTSDDFSGLFFNDYDLDISAQPNPGYSFDHWEGISSGSTIPNHSLTLDENKEIKAIFTKNTLQINEIMATSAAEESDWLELYNSGTEDINIAGMYISDDLVNPQKWKIPDSNPELTTMQPGDYLVLWADGDTTQGVLHLNFKLDNKGEPVSLTSQDGETLVSRMDYGKQHENKSYGDFPDGSLSRKYMSPTPGLANENFSGTYDLYINEFMASNSIIRDEYSEYDDWIEIYNNGSEEVDLAGFYLTDDFSDPVKYQISYDNPALTIIPSKGFLVIWTDNDSEQGSLHTNFKLRAAGEELALTEPGGQFFIDSLVFSNMLENVSRGRTEDGGNDWCDFVIATPGQSNVVSNIDLNTVSSIAAYPNPVIHNLTIQLEKAMISEHIEIIIMDIHGKPAFLTKTYAAELIDVDLSGLNAGVYLLKVIAKGQLYSKKIIKQ